METCSVERFIEHEKILNEVTSEVKHAQSRIDGLTDLFREFTTEMRVSNKNSSEMLIELKLLTREVGHVAKVTEKHDVDIAEIKDNMETKDTVLNLYNKIEDANSTYAKGMDAIMKQLRTHEEEFSAHKNEPANDALLREKQIKRWLIGAVGAIIGSQYIPEIISALFTK